MKRLLTIVCSLIVALAFTNVTLAVDSNLQKKDPSLTKQGVLGPKDIKNKGLKLETTNTQQDEGKKETNNSKKKVEKKNDEKKADDKK